MKKKTKRIYIEKAIELAAKNGFVLKPTYYIYGKKGLEDSGYHSVSDIFLDPLFWNCLGIALHWDTVIVISSKDTDGRNIYKCFETPEYYQHKLIDHIIHRGNYETFFKELISKS